jgi:hypothetical protein
VVYDALNRGLAEARAGRWYQAHEIWEQLWLEEPEPRRRALQALIQIAAAEIKRREGNRRGVELSLHKAAQNLTAAGPSAYGIDLVALSAQVEAAARSEAGSLELPERTGARGLLYLHGFASGPGSTKARRFAGALAPEGWSIAIPDLNQGDFEHLTLSRAIALAQRQLRDQTVVIGSSFGGYSAALLAARDRRVVGLILMAPAFDLARRLEARHGPDGVAKWRRDGFTTVDHYASQTPERIGVGILDDAAIHPAIPVLEVPSYILHGRADDTVPVELSERAAAQARAVVELDLVDDGHDLVNSVERAIEATRRMLDRLGWTPEE